MEVNDRLIRLEKRLEKLCHMWRKYVKFGTFEKEPFGKNIARNRAEMPIFRAFFGMEIMGFEPKSNAWNAVFMRLSAVRLEKRLEILVDFLCDRLPVVPQNMGVPLHRGVVRVP